MTDAFLDSNVLLYTLSGDAAKSGRAEALLKAGGYISVQVLNEFTWVARRKFQIDWPPIRSSLALFRALVEVLPITLQTHETGLTFAERLRLPVFDAMLLASAAHAGCATFYSEDLQDGMRVSGLTIRNPF